MRRNRLHIWQNICAGLLLGGGILTFAACDTGKQQVESAQCVGILPIKGGVSAPHAAVVSGQIWVGGGCNFPDIPAADGGKKVYYDELFVLESDADSLIVSVKSAFSAPVAYGASVALEDGMVCIGGMNQDSVWASAFLVGMNQGKMYSSPLPALPLCLDNGAAVFSDSCVYVTGGNQTDGQKGVFALGKGAKLADFADCNAWERVTDYPGQQRVQPVLLANNHSLFLIGGFQFDADKKECLLTDEVLRWDIHTREWQVETRLPADAEGKPRALVGASGVSYRHYLILTGGVNAEIFRTAMQGQSPEDYLRKEPEWYRFNKDILIYDTKRKEWTVIPEVQGMAKAGGVLLCDGKYLYMVCGETKPGVRTPEILRYPLSSLPLE